MKCDDSAVIIVMVVRRRMMMMMRRRRRRSDRYGSCDDGADPAFNDIEKPLMLAVAAAGCCLGTGRPL